MSRNVLMALTLVAAVRISAAKPPEDFSNSIGMKLKLVLPGEFMMGAPESDGNAIEDERPQHRVRITKPFFLSVTEVTQEQYRNVMQVNPSFFRGDNLPVERVTWNDAAKFCKRLSAKEDRVYRLPTEAEWEYACRAGSSGRYCFGEQATHLGEFAWFSHNAGAITHSVGEKTANAWGFFDMYGNVMEWCGDWYESDYYLRSPTEDPRGPSDISDRVCRGGAYAFAAAHCRSTSRYRFASDFHTYSLGWLGFRVVLCPQDQAEHPQKNPDVKVIKTDSMRFGERSATHGE